MRQSRITRRVAAADQPVDVVLAMLITSRCMDHLNQISFASVADRQQALDLMAQGARFAVLETLAWKS